MEAQRLAAAEESASAIARAIARASAEAEQSSSEVLAGSRQKEDAGASSFVGRKVGIPATDRTDEVYARNAGVPMIAATRFVEADPASVVDGVSADDFFAKSYDMVLLSMISHVVEVEGPVLDVVLARRIARAHGWQRTGARIQERVVGLATSAHRGTSEDVGTFFWPSHLEPSVVIGFRRAGDDNVRSVDEGLILPPKDVVLG